MEFHSAHSDVELARNLFVGMITQDGVQDFPLTWTERSGIGYGAAFVQEFLGTQFQPAGKHSIHGDQDREIVRLGTANQALHGKRAGHALDGGLHVRLGGTMELRKAASFFTEYEVVGLFSFEFPFVA